MEKEVKQIISKMLEFEHLMTVKFKYNGKSRIMVHGFKNPGKLLEFQKKWKEYYLPYKVYIVKVDLGPSQCELRFIPDDVVHNHMYNELEQARWGLFSSEGSVMEFKALNVFHVLGVMILPADK